MSMTWTVTALTWTAVRGLVSELGAATATNRIPHPASRMRVVAASSLERWMMVSRKKVFGICAEVL